MRIHKHLEAGGERGSALVLSLVAVATVVVLAASFSQFASSVASRQAQAVHRKRAFYMAEAGLAEAYAGLSCGKSGNVGTIGEPALLGNGIFWVEATELEPGIFKLESTGMVGTGRAELSIVAKEGKQDVTSLGVFSGGNLSLGAGSLVDAYDSTKGTYESQTDKSGAALGSNQDIVLTGTSEQPTKVKGDVTSGVGKTVTTSGTVTITGSKGEALQTTELPEVLLPEVKLDAAVKHGSAYPLVIPPGSVGYEGLQVLSGAEVIIQGPAQVVLGSLSLEASALLTFDTTKGPVELYVADALDLASESLMSTSSSKPEDVTIQVPGLTAQPVALRSSGAFHGVIYAPEATVVVGGAFELFGAVVADVLTFEGPTKLHFDKHLAALAAESALPKMITWRIVELGNLSGDLSTDPFDALALDPNVLPAPTQAHADQLLGIDYYDFSDVYHRYNGLESQFDWTVVQTVISATRDGNEVLFPSASSTKVGTIKKPATVPIVDGPML